MVKSLYEDRYRHMSYMITYKVLKISVLRRIVSIQKRILALCFNLLIFIITTMKVYRNKIFSTYIEMALSAFAVSSANKSLNLIER